MTNYVKDKVILITGAGSGFGALISQMTAEMGAKVVGVDINQDGLKSVFDNIQNEGHEAAFTTADVTSKEDMDAAANFTVEKFGRIDVLVNNAGIMPLAFFADHKKAWRAWDKVIDINFKGVVNGITAVYDQMVQQSAGQIVNISSIYGNYGIPGSGVYSATKAAVKVLSDSLRAETQGKIKVTTVKPTGVPGTNLGSGVINEGAVVGLTGINAAKFGQNMTNYEAGSLDSEQSDPNNIRYWTISPEELAQNVVYAINQPWGVNISDITVRASGEDYIY